MDIEKIRVFICVDFPSEIVQEIKRVQGILGNKKFIGKKTEEENLHLTLKFLGEIEEKEIEEVKKKLKEIKFNSFDSKLENAGTFSFKGNPRIVWMKIGGKGIFELQGLVDNALKELFNMEERFMSHVTIARVKYVKDKKEFKDYVEGIGVKKIGFKVDSFKLMKSELGKMGPVYTLIEEYKLG